jgi:hypothetical protein
MLISLIQFMYNHLNDSTMKKMIFHVLAISLIFFGCNGQTLIKGKGNEKKQSEPKIDIKVNKEYDKNGNLIQFDSTYSYFYSNIENNKNARDSIFNHFKKQFNEKYFFSKEPFFNDFFFEDSLLFYDFYKKDFFFNRFKNNMRKMDRLFLEMDSLKDSYYKKQLNKSSKNL